MKNAIYALLAVFLILSTGCRPSKDIASTCSVQPPATYKGDWKAALEVGADLTAFAKAPVSGNLKTEITKAVSATFQNVNDHYAACAMLQQTYVCIVSEERAREYMAFMRETGQCLRR